VFQKKMKGRGPDVPLKEGAGGNWRYEGGGKGARTKKNQFRPGCGRARREPGALGKVEKTWGGNGNSPNVPKRASAVAWEEARLAEKQVP